MTFLVKHAAKTEDVHVGREFGKNDLPTGSDERSTQNHFLVLTTAVARTSTDASKQR